MGTRSAVECSKIGMSEMGRRGEEDKGSVFFLVLFVFLFACFAGNIFAQDLDALVRTIQTGNTEQKRSALFDIRNLRNERASRIAIPALKDKNEMVRATAASSVVFLPKSEAVNALIPLLNDRSEFVRREAANALGVVGSRDASAPLLGLLQKERVYEVRTAAVIALGLTGDANAVTFLITVLRRKPAEDEEFLRRSAARSIGQIAKVICAGNRNVVTPQNFLPEKYKETPASQTEQLTALFPVFAQAVTELSRVLSDKNEDDDTRREAAFALGAIGDKSAVAVLESNINSPDYYLAEICKEALLKIRRSE